MIPIKQTGTPIAPSNCSFFHFLDVSWIVTTPTPPTETAPSGQAHCGQAEALSDTCLPHSGQLIRAMSDSSSSVTADFLPLLPKRIVHPRLCCMAVVAQSRQIGGQVVAAVHQRPPVIDFELMSAAADYASIPVPPPDSLLDRLGNISVMNDLVAGKSADVLVGLAEVVVDPLFADRGGDRRRLRRRPEFCLRGRHLFQVVMILSGLAVLVAAIRIDTAGVRVAKARNNENQGKANDD
jgi:hypothetical protein